MLSFILGKYLEVRLLDHMVYIFEGSICSASGFLNNITADVLGRIILCSGEFPIHFRCLIASIASTCTLCQYITPPPPNSDNPNYLQILPSVPWGQNSPPGENPCSTFLLRVEVISCLTSKIFYCVCSSISL